MMLIGSQNKEIYVSLGETFVRLVECECWTEKNHIIEFSSEFTAQKINQVFLLPEFVGQLSKRWKEFDGD